MKKNWNFELEKFALKIWVCLRKVGKKFVKILVEFKKNIEEIEKKFERCCIENRKKIEENRPHN